MEEVGAMARLTVDEDEVVVRLSGPEMLLARRSRIRVPLAQVRGASVEPDWWRVLRGEAHHHGHWLPDRFCVGAWEYPGGRDFVAVHEHGPVVLVDLTRSAPFARLAVSAGDAADAESAVRAIRRTL
ncbi:hypothetical protein ABZX77_49310 [Streptomyces sp. NPDC004237]|uniref:hypothetical protein n=1 Tax=Streptomyces sp. NPDC004237 TaxID=3154455 RepID=UPI00339DDD90